MDSSLLALFFDMFRIIKHVLLCVLSHQKVPSPLSSLLPLQYYPSDQMSHSCLPSATGSDRVRNRSIGDWSRLFRHVHETKYSFFSLSVGISPVLFCLIQSNQGSCFSRQFAQMELLSIFLESPLGWWHRTEPMLF